METLLLPHQRESVRAIEALFRKYGGAMLSDPPGSGKSWVAAQVAKNHEAAGGTVDLVIPSNLLEDWTTLASRFGFNPVIHEHASLFREPVLSSAESSRLVIVDEAHQFRNPLSRRFDALARLCVAQTVLLVTATPLWNSLRELGGLLALVANDDALREAGVFSIERAIHDENLEAIRVVIAGLAVRSIPASSSVLYPELHRRVVRFEGGSSEAAALVGSLEFPPFGTVATGLLRELLVLRLLSGRAAFLEAIERQIAFCERALEIARSGESLTRQDFARHFAREMRRGGRQQLLFPEMFSSGEVKGNDFDTLSRELEKLEKLRRSPLRSHKLGELVRIVGESPGKRWLVFTSSVATAGEIREALQSFGAAAVTAEADQSSRGATRAGIIDAFRSGKLAVLIATDWSSEGLNLQVADAVVHYDLPWNPSRLAQRTARACRFGRRESVTSWHFVPKELCFGKS